MEPEFMLFAFSLKTDIKKDPENLQMELINLQCDTKLNQKFYETKLQDFYSYMPKRKISSTQVCWVKNDCNARQHVCV
jgi:hypothetical protein